MNLLLSFQSTIKLLNLFSSKDKLLIAVSGGVDSVVLCELCKQAKFDFTIAHCNFQLRGAESERDEQFVKNLGNKYGVKVLVKKFETEKYATENKLSTQEAARNLRYEWFEDLINQSTNQPINHLLTAHHSDDNAETIAMNFFRGTGLHGLTGIPGKNGYIKRPLLEISKEELLAYARENNLEFVEDSSNQSSKYTRNYFRNEIIPAISKIYPQVKDNLLDNINRFKEIEKLYQLSVSELKKKICKQKGNEFYIPVNKLMSYNNKALIYEIIHPFNFQEKQVEELIKLTDSDSGKYITSPDNQFRIIKHRLWFIISPVVATESVNIIIEENDKQVSFSLGNLSIETISNNKPSTSSGIATLDAREIKFPLLLRKWKTGDYFYPLGMKKKKKVSRFLIDSKLSKTEKENTWVIECKQRICWIVGQRIDDRFKLTATTKEVLKLTYQAK
ncbi:MAG: tRNA lysidine(34) synthetase TilS [Chitinophagaceae bacterium]|nr:tRNA lysidine(34) synthetase TilS [Chitinophagaceae bacterium]HQX96336.1 tRNA lysidine(34) synthetase TilS [Chitinophagaceae bacterium]HQZ51705.1 tRNA lysidine(34) synthetase TilS [Chitinophagaceae bacterium]HRA11950.1 tRNA lysidine(34) synthetase TilS [Chitinophagaceae bacterium]